MKKVLMNTTNEGLAYAITATMPKNASIVNIVNGGGITQVRESWRYGEIVTIGRIYPTSLCNGTVYHPSGICPCITVGAHGGNMPKNLVYEE